MRSLVQFLTLGLLLSVIGKPVFAGDRLFDDDTILELSIEADLKILFSDNNGEFLRNSSESEPFVRDKGVIVPGTVTVYEDNRIKEVQNVSLKTRGNARLDYCRFPPLKIEVPKTYRGDSKTFDKTKEVKLVTHCDHIRLDRMWSRDGTYLSNQLLLEEYLLYKFYQELSEFSFGVRLARITYVDLSGKIEPVTKYAFFIEDVDEMAERLDMKEVEPDEVDSKNYNFEVLAQVMVFQVFISNADYSTYDGKNVKMLENSDGRVVPVPYDFDWSGLLSHASNEYRLSMMADEYFCKWDEAWLNPPIEKLHEKRRVFFEMTRSLEPLREYNADFFLSGMRTFYDITSSNGVGELCAKHKN